MQKPQTIIAVLLALCVLIALPASAEDWGTLKGQFLYGGKFSPVEVKPTKDIAFCSKHKIFDDTLTVGKNNGVKDIAVYLYLKPEQEAPAPHPSYAKTADAKIELANKGCRFEPHVVLLRTSQTLLVSNPDSVGHNTKIDVFNEENESINPLVPAGRSIEHKFNAEERVPITVGCSIHPWMTARILIKDSPYMAVTDELGNFEIKNVPPGDWTFRFYHERVGYVQDVSVNGKKTKWLLGRKKLSFAKGVVNDLGKITLAPEIFEKD